jgi:hypothetical protein
LVAVERANGGELAPLMQVLWTLDSVVPPGSRPDPARFAASVTLLIELGVVEYVENQLGLTVEGRKLLRRSGLPNDARHVARVTDLLQEFDELDIDRDKPATAPTEHDVRRALSDEEQTEETVGGVGTPDLGKEVPIVSGRGVLGSPWVPAVLPEDSSEDELATEADPSVVAPAHPLLNRLFGRERRRD